MKRAKSSAASAVSSRNYNIRPARRKPRSPNQFGPARKSVETILAHAGAEKNTRSATEKQHRSCHVKFAKSKSFALKKKGQFHALLLRLKLAGRNSLVTTRSSRLPPSQTSSRIASSLGSVCQ